MSRKTDDAPKGVGKTIATSPEMDRPLTHAEREEKRSKEMEVEAATRRIDPHVFKKAKRGWCLFRAKRRCYVEGILIEEMGWEIALSPEAAIRVRGNKHLQLIAGEWPQTKEEVVRDQYGDPVYSKETGVLAPKVKLVLADEQLKELDGDPILRRVNNPEDEQEQLRGMVGHTTGAGARPAQYHPGYVAKVPAA